MKKYIRKYAPAVYIIILVMALAGCGKKDNGVTTTTTLVPEFMQENNVVSQDTSVQKTEIKKVQTDNSDNPIKGGEGDVFFQLEIIDDDANITYYELWTDKEYLADALIDNGIAEFEDSENRKFSTVNGMAAPADAYWAIYIDSEITEIPPNLISIKHGLTYSIKTER